MPIETLLAEVPVSGKLKHLISRMIGSEVLKRFGIQVFFSPPPLKSPLDSLIIYFISILFQKKFKKKIEKK